MAIAPYAQRVTYTCECVPPCAIATVVQTDYRDAWMENRLQSEKKSIFFDIPAS